MLGSGGELVTAVLGADAPADLADLLEDHLRMSHPEVELTVYAGGQPDTIIFVGVE
jgi:dihydroxyacetone kinase-like predicted kinase